MWVNISLWFDTGKIWIFSSTRLIIALFLVAEEKGAHLQQAQNTYPDWKSNQSGSGNQSIIIHCSCTCYENSSVRCL